MFGKSSVRTPLGAGMGPHPPGDPEAPADRAAAADASERGLAPRAAADEPTQLLPVVSPSRSRRPPPPAVAARAVIVYEERPRRPWRLTAFTAVLVALTVGVVLGQAEAFERTYRSTANAQTVVVPPASGPIDQPWPDAAHRVTAPLTSARTRALEVAGAATVLRIRSLDLGDALLDIATTDRSAVPRLTDTDQGSRLELIPTGGTGTAGAEIQLNAKVAWTLRLTGGAPEQHVDMRAGGVAGIAIVGGTGRVDLQLPEAKGTVPLSLTGPVRDLTVRTISGTPIRLRLGAGADTTVVDGKTRRNVKAGTAITSAGWRSAKNRYDVTTSDAVNSVLTATK